jgi:hypothetical protein
MVNEKQRLFEVPEGEIWSDFHDQIDELLHEEKKYRQENDTFKLSEICLRIVSGFASFEVSSKIWLGPTSVR